MQFGHKIFAPLFWQEVRRISTAMVDGWHYKLHIQWQNVAASELCVLLFCHEYAHKQGGPSDV